MAESTIYSHFCFKSCRVEDLKDSRVDGPIRVQVAKIIQLTQEQYRHFCSHLLEDMPFIKNNNRLKGNKGKDVPLCLLVTTRNIRGGILVDCQGYSFARYAAAVPDKSALDLRNVPVDHYDLKLRQPRSQRER